MTMLLEGRTLRDRAYRVVHLALSARAERRHRRDFEDVERFCLFVGYPRSGHSIVGAMLNAHRHAVVAHELNAPLLIQRGCSRNALFAQIIARAYWFDLRGNTTNYRYQIPHQWQGRFASLKVIGDKRGGAVTRSIAVDPRFLDTVRALVGVPLRLIHVVRNPFDNIAAISIWHRLSLPESADFYFRHCETTAQLPGLTSADELFQIRHEDLIQEPADALRRLCAFLSLDAEPDYLMDCAGVVFKIPSRTRQKVEWSAALVARIEARLETLPFLRGYGVE